MLMTNNLKTTNKYLIAAVVAVTIGSLVTSVLYWSAVFGSSLAMNTLMTLSLPKYNPFAAMLIPDDLGATPRWGMELLLGVVILLLTSVLFAIAAAGLWLKTRKAA